MDGFVPHRETLPSSVAWKEKIRVAHQQFICRGLLLPLQNFVHGLLFFFGSQLHHLTPNGILHIELFRYFF